MAAGEVAVLVLLIGFSSLNSYSLPQGGERLSRGLNILSQGRRMDPFRKIKRLEGETKVRGRTLFTLIPLEARLGRLLRLNSFTCCLFLVNSLDSINLRLSLSFYNLAQDLPSSIRTATWVIYPSFMPFRLSSFAPSSDRSETLGLERFLTPRTPISNSTNFILSILGKSSVLNFFLSFPEAHYEVFLILSSVRVRKTLSSRKGISRNIGAQQRSHSIGR